MRHTYVICYGAACRSAALNPGDFVSIICDVYDKVVFVSGPLFQCAIILSCLFADSVFYSSLGCVYISKLYCLWNSQFWNTNVHVSRMSNCIISTCPPASDLVEKGGTWIARDCFCLLSGLATRGLSVFIHVFLWHVTCELPWNSSWMLVTKLTWYRRQFDICSGQVELLALI